MTKKKSEPGMPPQITMEERILDSLNEIRIVLNRIEERLQDILNHSEASQIGVSEISNSVSAIAETLDAEVEDE